MSNTVWEVKVSEYLKKIVKHATSVDYGVAAIRWRGGKFDALREKLIADRYLRNIGNEVLLKLPAEPLRSF